MPDAYIVEAVRTPIGKGKETGILAGIHPVKLLALMLGEVCNRAGIHPGEVEDVLTGCVSPVNEQGGNIARLALLTAGFPVEVPGVQLNRVCGSSQQAVHFASQAVAAGDMDLVIASGIEMMSCIPMFLDWGDPRKDFLEDYPYELWSMGECGELLAERQGHTREALDVYAAESQRRAANARMTGRFEEQIMPVPVEYDGVVQIAERDEGIRLNTTVERLTGLLPVFKENGVITAGNASQISDGAAAILIASGKKADELGLAKRARIVARGVVGSDPDLVLTGPAAVTRQVLKRAGLTMADIDVFEINEAFATVVLTWAEEMQPPDMDRVNPNGGAIALGHPLGATGAILMTKLVHELERTGGHYGLQAMCIGGGMATGTIIERV